MEVVKQSLKTLAKAVSILRNGGIIVCPTDTVYGFLADASNKKAVDKIFKIKKRAKSKPLPLFVKDIRMAKKIAEIDKRQAKILTLRLRSGQGKFWPGKYTFVLKRKNIDVGCLYKLYGVAKDTVALRIPKHKFLNDLLKKINRPLVQTSVNISAKKPLNDVDDIIATFGKNKLIGLIIDAGNVKNAKPSKVYDFTTPDLTRLR